MNRRAGITGLLLVSAMLGVACGGAPEKSGDEIAQVDVTTVGPGDPGSGSEVTTGSVSPPPVTEGPATTEGGGKRPHDFLNTTCTGDSDGILTAPITDIETLDSIIPSGVAAGEEIKPHSYLRIAGDRAPVYAPIDMELVQGSWYKEPESFVAETTYILHFAVGCNFAINLDHITEPVDEIKAVLNDVPREDTRMDEFLRESVKFEAGDLIGYTIGAGPEDFVRTYDFGYYGSATNHEYVNQDRYLRSYAWKQLHAVCAFDYFAEPLKTTYIDLLTTHTGQLVPGAPCRSPNQDKAGTLAGAWYFEPDSMSVVNHVGIAQDLDDKSMNIVGLPSQSYVRIESPNPSLKDPAEVTDRHCYDYSGNVASYFYFVLVDAMTVDLYEGSGTCPAEPSGQVTRLYR